MVTFYNVMNMLGKKNFILGFMIIAGVLSLSAFDFSAYSQNPVSEQQEQEAQQHIDDITAMEEESEERIGQAEQGASMAGSIKDKVGSLGGGCLIATATYGSEFAPQVQMLREIRDNVILETNSGTAFMTAFNQFYYSFSPTIADYERENPVFKEAVKLTITPLLTSLSILNYVDINSEAEMLGYGIGVILLNIGMYFVAPVVVITKLRK